MMRNYARSLRHGMAVWRVLRARHDGVSGHGDLFGVVVRMPRHTPSTPCPCARNTWLPSRYSQLAYCRELKWLKRPVSKARTAARMGASRCKIGRAHV